jgi:hypothetical protein
MFCLLEDIKREFFQFLLFSVSTLLAAMCVQQNSNLFRRVKITPIRVLCTHTATLELRQRRVKIGQKNDKKNDETKIRKTLLYSKKSAEKIP